MQRLLLLLAAISLSLPGVVFSPINKSSDVAQPPRLLLENDRVQVYAVNIPAGQQAFIRHPHNFLTVTLDDSQMVMWQEGFSADASFRINRGDYRSQKWEYGSNALGPPADRRAGFVQTLSLQAAVVRDAQLLSGEQLPALPQPARELLIAVTDLNLTVGTNADVRKSAGEIAWLEGRNSALMNQGTAPVRFVEVELK